jgi:cytochrome c peroxidase
MLLCASSAFSGELRYPVAAVRVDERTLATPNERSGSISLIDLRDHRVVEQTIGGTPSAIATGKDFLLVTDAQNHTLQSWRRGGEKLERIATLEVSDHPAGLALSRDGRRALVASLWSRALDVVSVDDGRLKRTATLPLHFPARRILLTPDDRLLIVADAFGGQIEVFDAETIKSVGGVRRFHAHNIYGLAWDVEQDRLLVAHQILNSELPVDFDNVQWGAVLKNVVRSITREQLLDTSVDLNTKTRVYSLGQEGDGSADPTAVVPLASGAFAVALGGANEMLLVNDVGTVSKRFALGKRPIALLRGEKPSQLVAVNQFDSSLSIFDFDRDAVTHTISLGKQREKLTPAERGERLFYDARLSFEKWMSCHSCHTEGHTNGQLADTLGDGNYGAPKRTLTLLGTRDTDRWAWNGEIKELHDQVRKSVETSMQGKATSDELFDLTAYLHTLAPPPPLARAKDDADRAQIARGQKVFEAQKCNACHIAPLTYTSHDVYDVGLSDERGQTKFNPPSLRGVGQGQRFLHDGRASALEDVFDVYGHQVREPLNESERADLLRFLRSL